METLNLIDFPPWVDSNILKHTPQEYSTLMVHPHYHPYVINPSSIPSLLKEGKRFMAYKSVNGETIWIASWNPVSPEICLREFQIGKKQYLVPCCYQRKQHWTSSIDWEKLANMKMGYTGKYIVFVPKDYFHDKIEINRCTFIEVLQAYVLSS